ncbi:MAG: TolC family protein [Saprospiraceae bacterium]
MKRIRLTTYAICFLPFLGLATDTLSVEQCRTLALKNSPIQQKKLYAESINALQIRNLQSNTLPRIQAGAQASWQSDVFGLPFSFPGSEFPVVPKDQYKLSIEVAQRIWDGGTDRILRQQREVERAVISAQVDVDAFSLREVVTDLYFKALLLQESEAVLLSSKKGLEARLRQAEAAVAGGTALRTSADQVKIQLLKTEQQIYSTQSDHLAILEVLAKWLGRDKADFLLIIPKLEHENKSPLGKPAGVGNSEKLRPEHTLFLLQQRGLQTGKDALGLRAQPRIEAFAQGGLGRPNPFNFFETGFEPFVLVGLRAAWSPIDWGNKRREAQVFDLQIKSIDLQRQFFDQKLEASTFKDLADALKWKALLTQDDAIIALQTDILERAEAQVRNGVMTMTDFLMQQNLLTQAQLTKKSHEVQAAQALEMFRAKTGN